MPHNFVKKSPKGFGVQYRRCRMEFIHLFSAPEAPLEQ
jgi:hypothetical protein